MQLTTTIFDDDDNPIEVTGWITKGCRGSRNEYGVPMEPDEPDDVEITDARDMDDYRIELTDNQEEQAREALLEAWYER